MHKYSTVCGKTESWETADIRRWVCATQDLHGLAVKEGGTVTSILTEGDIASRWEHQPQTRIKYSIISFYHLSLLLLVGVVISNSKITISFFKQWQVSISALLSVKHWIPLRTGLSKSYKQKSSEQIFYSRTAIIALGDWIKKWCYFMCGNSDYKMRDWAACSLPWRKPNSEEPYLSIW